MESWSCTLPLAWHVSPHPEYQLSQAPNTRSKDPPLLRFLLPLVLRSSPRSKIYPHIPHTLRTYLLHLRSTLSELDYNLHESNDKYFTDLDIARGHHIYFLFRVGVNEYGSRDSSALSTGSTGSTKPPPTGHFIMALGGVTCTLKRELKPYRKYEIWTRVLSWDEKWIYVISHIVKPDSTNPTAYSDQPWKKTGTGEHSSFGK